MDEHEDDDIRSLETYFTTDKFAGEASARNKMLTRLLKSSLETRKNLHDDRRGLRKKFFVIVCTVFVVVIVLGMLTILALAFKENVTLTDLGVVAASLGSIIVAIIKLPEIIATHLFPPEGDKMDDDLIREIINFDLENSDNLLNETGKGAGSSGDTNGSYPQ